MRGDDNAFDFVHTRLVLLHIPAREAVLRRLVAALRPGGVLLLEEDDISPVLATARGAYRDARKPGISSVHGPFDTASRPAD